METMVEKKEAHPVGPAFWQTSGADPGQMSGVVPGGLEVARRHRLLVERFPRADGDPWRGTEVDAASGGLCTGSYFSALGKGKLRQPGFPQLSAIADVLGFPVELWGLPPELWDEYLAQHPPRGGFRSVAPGHPVPRVPAGEELAGLLNGLFEERPNPATGEPFTEDEVAMRSGGRLTAGQIAWMRSGNQQDPPPELWLVTISNIFDVPYSYWSSGSSGAGLEGEAGGGEAGGDRAPAPLDTVEVGLLGAVRTLPRTDREAVLSLVRRLAAAGGTAEAEAGTGVGDGAREVTA